ncbi:MAG: hypothetical protein H6713_21775 [Myxococcales bacterium]|nr:hypothetical protein [Myxococcales bacterium]
MVRAQQGEHRARRALALTLLTIPACVEPWTPSASSGPIGQVASSATDSGATLDDGATTGASASPSAGAGSTAASTGGEPDASTTGAKFDVGQQPDSPPAPGCPGDGPDLIYSHIWIANSPLGTVSKIDTRTRVELARYVTAPDHAGNPSRTSVNRAGDVAVVNRAGGVVKIAGQLSRCVDRDGDGLRTTATSPTALPWGDDECVLWYTPLPVESRPAAWTPGELVTAPTPDDDGCKLALHDARLWTSAPVGSDIHVYLLDGETGDVEGTAVIPGIAGPLGVYGGAVNAAGDFWGVVYPYGPLVRVALADLAHEVIELAIPSAYGFTVDAHGRPWVGGFDGALQRLHPTTHSWVTVDTGGLWSLMRGMTEDQDGVLWVATLAPPGLLMVDTTSAEAIAHLGEAELPGVDTPTGASVDGEGKIWLVDQQKDGGGAFVFDPVTAELDFVGGLDAPYTYSDMTGWALGNVAPPSG